MRVVNQLIHGRDRENALVLRELHHRRVKDPCHFLVGTILREVVRDIAKYIDELPIHSIGFDHLWAFRSVVVAIRLSRNLEEASKHEAERERSLLDIEVDRFFEK